MTDTIFAAIEFRDILHNLDSRFGLSADCRKEIHDALMSAYRRGREDGANLPRLGAAKLDWEESADSEQSEPSEPCHDAEFGCKP